MFLLQAFAVCYSFTAAAFRSDFPSVADDPWALLRLAIPATVVCLILLLRNGLVTAEPRGPHAAAIDLAIALGGAVLSQLALAQIAPELTLPRWAPTQGAFVSWLFLVGVRAFFPPGQNHDAPPITLDSLRWNAERRRMFGYGAAAVVITACGTHMLLSSSLRARFGSALIIAGALYVALALQRRGLPASDAVFALELQREADLHWRFWYWWFGSLVPGCLLIISGSAVYAYFVLLYVLLAAEINLRAAESVVVSKKACEAPPIRGKD